MSRNPREFEKELNDLADVSHQKDYNLFIDGLFKDKGIDKKHEKNTGWTNITNDEWKRMFTLLDTITFVSSVKNVMETSASLSNRKKTHANLFTVIHIAQLFVEYLKSKRLNLTEILKTKLLQLFTLLGQSELFVTTDNLTNTEQQELEKNLINIIIEIYFLTLLNEYDDDAKFNMFKISDETDAPKSTSKPERILTPVSSATDSLISLLHSFSLGFLGGKKSNKTKKLRHKFKI
jgi:hypothetical protein